jgi:hypothetical protein
MTFIDYLVALGVVALIAWAINEYIADARRRREHHDRVVQSIVRRFKYMCDCDDNPPSCLTIKTRVARKAHCCCECWRQINPGDTSEYASGIWDG